MIIFLILMTILFCMEKFEIDHLHGYKLKYAT